MLILVCSVFTVASGLVYSALIEIWMNVLLMFSEISPVTLAARGIAVTIALIDLNKYA